MKKVILILVLILISIIAGIAGCTSQNNNFQNTDSTSNYNQSHDSQLNKTATTSKNYDASGYCYNVIDGDTIDVEGIGRIRLVGVNTPEIGQAGYGEAKNFVTSLCLGKTVYLDIDNAKHHDKYGRTLAVVYSGDTNVNAELLKKEYAEIMYIPPSEFNPHLWVDTSNYQITAKTTGSNIKSVTAGYYIGNINSKKFHTPDCVSVSKMSENNKIRLSSRQNALNNGYDPCKNCNP